MPNFGNPRRALRDMACSGATNEPTCMTEVSQLGHRQVSAMEQDEHVVQLHASVKQERTLNNITARRIMINNDGHWTHLKVKMNEATIVDMLKCAAYLTRNSKAVLQSEAQTVQAD